VFACRGFLYQCFLCCLSYRGVGDQDGDVDVELCREVRDAGRADVFNVDEGNAGVGDLAAEQEGDKVVADGPGGSVGHHLDRSRD
jgi:hypothetical protein